VANNGPLDSLKNELTAAVAISAGVLIGSGYGLVWARLHANERYLIGGTPVTIPREPILSALPTSFFLSTAVQLLLVPLVILMTVGILLLFILLLRRNLSLWAIAGIVLSLTGWLFVDTFDRFRGALAFGRGSTEALTSAGVVCLAMALLAVGLGALVNQVPDRDALGLWDRIRPVAAALLVLITVGMSALRLIDAYFSNQPFPAAVILADGSLCGGDQTRGASQSCVLAGLYIGQGSGWVDLVPLEPPTPAEHKQNPQAVLFVRRRLLQVPTDKVLQLRLANDPDKAFEPGTCLNQAFNNEAHC
jgi:hypothetical protein